jgi:hypothetical protein
VQYDTFKPIIIVSCDKQSNPISDIGNINRYIDSQCRGHCDQHVAPDSKLLIAPAGPALTAALPQPVNVLRRAFGMSFLPVDACPQQHLQRILLHSLTQVVICTTGDAKVTLGRRRCSWRITTLREENVISFNSHHSRTSVSIGGWHFKVGTRVDWDWSWTHRYAMDPRGYRYIAYI